MQIEHHLLSKRVVVDNTCFIRNLIVEITYSEGRIGGPSIFVEIDFIYFFKRKNQVGPLLGSSWVFGAVERNDISREIVMITLDGKRNTLLSIIENHVEIR
ncbi:hypothetical protein RF11_07203 [Thelohanellus kitauei]|uniref:Uncharacterized protein n=1 Tax=Thelohanellus kitauei TaxID=669202 RepID=A0A0C2JNV0_THEKT|nr:hypothetical protein RF11_07203 [Thelohanellus kitauei]